jgi:hypothetical protein
MRTLAEKAAEKDGIEACAKVRAQLQDPGVQKFVDTLSLLWGGNRVANPQRGGWEPPARASPFCFRKPTPALYMNLRLVGRGVLTPPSAIRTSPDLGGALGTARP